MNIILKQWTIEDKVELIALCNAVDRTYLSDRLPYPYSDADADWWMEMVELNEGKTGIFRAIVVDGRIVGSISVECDGNSRGRGEIGYMLSTDYWSRGIATKAVSQICKIAFEKLSVDCIGAKVYESNMASVRVLEKNGFVYNRILDEPKLKKSEHDNLLLFDLQSHGVTTDTKQVVKRSGTPAFPHSDTPIILAGPCSIAGHRDCEIQP